MGLTVPQCELVTKIQEAYNSDSTLKQLYQSVLCWPEEHSGFKIVKGILLYHDKIYISDQSPLKQSFEGISCHTHCWSCWNT